MVASNRRERTRAVQLWLWAPPERPKRRLPEGVDLNFRPSSYWAWPTAISPNIKGEQRRKWLKDAVSGRGTPLEEFPPGFFADSLEEPARQLVGRIHPSFMGGEYLPDYRRGEVEIARVSLRSTTGDVMSVRARPLKRGVGYRVVDEYPDMHVWRCWPKTSQVPLTLRGMIRLLDTAGLYSTEGVRFSTGLVEELSLIHI